MGDGTRNQHGWAQGFKLGGCARSNRKLGEPQRPDVGSREENGSLPGASMMIHVVDNHARAKNVFRWCSTSAAVMRIERESLGGETLMDTFSWGLVLAVVMGSERESLGDVTLTSLK